MTDVRTKKKYYFRKSKNKYFLEPGFRGFFCTCNFREKDCVKEAYNILNEYADKLYPKGDPKEPVQDEEDRESGSEDDAEPDIGDALKQQLESMKKDNQKSLKHKRFQAVETGASNCVFIKTNLPSPGEITSAIIKDLMVTKLQKTRHLLRLVPILGTCKANLPDIMECAGTLLDKYFLKESSTFAIVFNKRFNDSVSRDMIIRELAEMIVLKNGDNKADLKNPKLCVVVEVIKGMCLLGVVDNYYTYKKYNLLELCKEEQSNDTEVSQPKKMKSDSSDDGQPPPVKIE